MTDEIGTTRVKVQVSDILIEVEGSEGYVDEKFEELSSELLPSSPHKAQTLPVAANPSAKDEQKAKEISLAELYSQADIKYKRDAALLVGCYLELIEDQDDFTRSEIEEAALKAKVELGKNLHRDFGTLVENGFIKKIGERNNEPTYYLTRTGESHVSEEFGITSYL